MLAVNRLNPSEVLLKVEWTVLSFFLGLFILVGGLVETGAVDKVQEFLTQISGGEGRNLSLLLLWGGSVTSVINNIPYTTAMSQVVKQLVETGAGAGVSPLWWALVLGADLGGNATMVGAAANVYMVNGARAAGFPIGFGRFFKYGVVVVAGTLLVSTVYLWSAHYR